MAMTRVAGFTLAMALIIASLVFVVSVLHAQNTTNTDRTETIEDTMAVLRAHIPAEPMPPDVKTQLSMHEIAKSQRADSLEVLIDLLGYTSDNSVSDALLTTQDSICSIWYIKHYYDRLALPYLYVKGITTEKRWMRIRCAYTIQAIADKKTIVQYNEIYSLPNTKNTSAKEFFHFLQQYDLEKELISKPAPINYGTVEVPVKKRD